MTNETYEKERILDQQDVAPLIISANDESDEDISDFSESE